MLRANGFNAVYATDIAAAREQVLQLIPKGATVGIGDSASVRQLDVLDRLVSEGRVLVDLFSKPISLSSSAGEISIEQRRQIGKLAINCEFFLTGTNALTEDGKLVNTDGYGNRVGGMIFGPRSVLIVAGRNKLVKSTDEAFYRIRNVIAPEHAKAKGKKTPCVKTGRCTDCSSPDRICRVTTIIEKAIGYTTITILAVEEDLGLGWNEDWPKERIDRIRSAYAELTWLRLKSAIGGTA